ncbi:MAG: hypothetical protein ACR2PR_09360 [Pseudohongiellaceae bacterium]
MRQRDSKHWSDIINYNVDNDLPLALAAGSREGRFRVLGDPRLADDLDFGGVLAKVDEDGKITQVNAADLQKQDDFYVFGEDSTKASGFRIISAGYKDNDGKLRLEGSKMAAGRDVRSFARGFAAVKDAGAGIAGALGADGVADWLSGSADETRDYQLRGMNHAEKADDYNRSQSPFNLLDSNQLRDTVLQSAPFQAVFGGSLGIARGVGAQLAKRGLTKTAGALPWATAGGTNAALNFGSVREEVLDILIENGVEPEVAKKLATRSGFIPAAVSAATGALGGAGRVGKNATLAQRVSPFGRPLGSAPFEGGTEVLEELSQASAVEDATGEAPPHGYGDLALRAFTGGVGGQVLFGGAVGLPGEVSAIYRRNAAIDSYKGAIHNFQRNKFIMQMHRRSESDSKVDKAGLKKESELEIFSKSLKDLRRWRARGKEVLEMIKTPGKLSINFGKYFPTGMSEPDLMVNVVGALAAMEEYGDGLFMSGTPPQMDSIVKASEDGDEGARAFFDTVREKYELGDVSDAEAADILNMDLDTPDDATNLYGRHRVGRFWGSLFPRAGIADGEMQDDAKTKIYRKYNPADIIAASGKIADAFAAEAKKKDGVSDSESAARIAKGMKEAPIKTLHELGLIKSFNFMRSAFADKDKLNQLVNDIGDPDLTKARDLLDQFDGESMIAKMRVLEASRDNQPAPKTGTGGDGKAAPPSQAAVIPNILQDVAQSFTDYKGAIRAINRFLARNDMEALPEDADFNWLYPNIGATENEIKESLTGILDEAAKLVEAGHLGFERIPNDLQPMVVNRLKGREWDDIFPDDNQTNPKHQFTKKGDRHTDAESGVSYFREGHSWVVEWTDNGTTRRGVFGRNEGENAVRFAEEVASILTGNHKSSGNNTGGRSASDINAANRFVRQLFKRQRKQEAQDRADAIASEAAEKEAAAAKKEAAIKDRDEKREAAAAARAEASKKAAKARELREQRNLANQTYKNSIADWRFKEEQRRKDELHEAKMAQAVARKEQAQAKADDAKAKAAKSAAGAALALEKLEEARANRDKAPSAADVKKAEDDATNVGHQSVNKDEAAALAQAAFDGLADATSRNTTTNPYGDVERTTSREDVYEEETNTNAAGLQKRTPSSGYTQNEIDAAERAKKREDAPPSAEFVVELEGVQVRDENGRLVDAPTWVHKKYNNKDRIPIDKVNINEKLFQHRVHGTDAGRGGLKNQKVWKPLQGEGMTFYRDTKGKLWVVDGHHRYKLAKRMEAIGKQPKEDMVFLAPTILSAADGWTERSAMFYGGIKNIMEAENKQKGVKFDKDGWPTPAPPLANILDAAGLYRVRNAPETSAIERGIFDALVEFSDNRTMHGQVGSLYLGKDIALLQDGGWNKLLEVSEYKNANNPAKFDPLTVVAIARGTNKYLPAEAGNQGLPGWNERRVGTYQANMIQIVIDSSSSQKRGFTKAEVENQVSDPTPLALWAAGGKPVQNTLAGVDKYSEAFDQMGTPDIAAMQTIVAIMEIKRDVGEALKSTKNNISRKKRTYEEDAADESTSAEERAVSAQKAARAEKELLRAMLNVEAYQGYMDGNTYPVETGAGYGELFENEVMAIMTTPAKQVKARTAEAVKKLYQLIQDKPPRAPGATAEKTEDESAEDAAHDTGQMFAFSPDDKKPKMRFATKMDVRKFSKMLAAPMGLMGVRAELYDPSRRGELGYSVAGRSMNESVIYVSAHIDDKAKAMIVAHELAHLVWTYGSESSRNMVKRLMPTWANRRMANGLLYSERAKASLAATDADGKSIFDYAAAMPGTDWKPGDAAPKAGDARAIYLQEEWANELFALAVEAHIGGKYGGDFISKIRSFFRQLWAEIAGDGSYKVARFAERGEFMRHRRAVGDARRVFVLATQIEGVSEELRQLYEDEALYYRAVGGDGRFASRPSWIKDDNGIEVGDVWRLADESDGSRRYTGIILDSDYEPDYNSPAGIHGHNPGQRPIPVFRMRKRAVAFVLENAVKGKTRFAIAPGVFAKEWGSTKQQMFFKVKAAQLIDDINDEGIVGDISVHPRRGNVQNVSVRGNRRKGYGAAMYLAVAKELKDKHNIVLNSRQFYMSNGHPARNEKATALWDYLVDMGYATKVKDADYKMIPEKVDEYFADGARGKGSKRFAMSGDDGGGFLQQQDKSQVNDDEGEGLKIRGKVKIDMLKNTLLTDKDGRPLTQTKEDDPLIRAAEKKRDDILKQASPPPAKGGFRFAIAPSNSTIGENGEYNKDNDKELARFDGEVITAYHGTPGDTPPGDFSFDAAVRAKAKRLDTDPYYLQIDLGFHFSLDRKVSQSLLNTYESSSRKPDDGLGDIGNISDYHIAAKIWWVPRDPGFWNEANRVREALSGRFDKETIPEYKETYPNYPDIPPGKRLPPIVAADAGRQDTIDGMRRVLLAHNIKAIAYPNFHEGIGEPSVVVLDPSVIVRASDGYRMIGDNRLRPEPMQGKLRFAIAPNASSVENGVWQVGKDERSGEFMTVGQARPHSEDLSEWERGENDKKGDDNTPMAVYHKTNVGYEDFDIEATTAGLVWFADTKQSADRSAEMSNNDYDFDEDGNRTKRTDLLAKPRYIKAYLSGEVFDAHNNERHRQIYHEWVKAMTAYDEEEYRRRNESDDSMEWEKYLAEEADSFTQSVEGGRDYREGFSPGTQNYYDRSYGDSRQNGTIAPSFHDAYDDGGKDESFQAWLAREHPSFDIIKWYDTGDNGISYTVRNPENIVNADTGYAMAKAPPPKKRGGKKRFAIIDDMPEDKPGVLYRSKVFDIEVLVPKGEGADASLPVFALDTQIGELRRNDMRGFTFFASGEGFPAEDFADFTFRSTDFQGQKQSAGEFIKQMERRVADEYGIDLPHLNIKPPDKHDVVVGKRSSIEYGYPVFVNGVRVGWLNDHRQWEGSRSSYAFFSSSNDDWWHELQTHDWDGITEAKREISRLIKLAKPKMPSDISAKK